MAIMDIAVLPIGTGNTSIAKSVARAARVARESGLDARVMPMSTVVEGNTDELMQLAVRMHRSVLEEGVARVVTTVRIDERTDKEEHIDERVPAVEKEFKTR
jgi:uncharacterized protein (TIGR00106 family)